jgi:hypothetical protein
MRWLTAVHRTARDHSHARLHGFGLTIPEYLRTFPWYSVDSSYWTRAPRAGGLALFDARTGRWTTGRVGRPLPRPFRTLARDYDGDPAELQRPGYGLIRVNGRHAIAQREWLLLTGARAALRFNAWLRARRPPVTAPAGMTDDGPIYHLAVSDRDELHAAVKAAGIEAATPSKGTDRP